MNVKKFLCHFFFSGGDEIREWKTGLIPLIFCPIKMYEIIVLYMMCWLILLHFRNKNGGILVRRTKLMVCMLLFYVMLIFYMLFNRTFFPVAFNISALDWFSYLIANTHTHTTAGMPHVVSFPWLQNNWFNDFKTTDFKNVRRPEHEHTNWYDLPLSPSQRHNGILFLKSAAKGRCKLSSSKNG